jgi:hypothetical protein
MPRNPTAQRCNAHSSRTEEPCKRWARRGYTVCSSHGAGTAKRERDGTRQNPILAGVLATGGTRMTPRTRELVEAASPEFAAAVASYRADPTALQDMNELLAWLGALRDKAAREGPLAPVQTKHGFVQSPLLRITKELVDTAIAIKKLELEADRQDSIPLRLVQPFIKEVVDVVYELVGEDERAGILERLRRRLPVADT